MAGGGFDVYECNKVRQKYCPDLFQDFADTKDPHNPSYTDYSNRELLGTMLYKGIAGITIMQAMTDEFNKDQVVKTCTSLWAERKRNSCRMGPRSMNTLKGWIRMNYRKCSRSVNLIIVTEGKPIPTPRTGIPPATPNPVLIDKSFESSCAFIRRLFFISGTWNSYFLRPVTIILHTLKMYSMGIFYSLIQNTVLLHLPSSVHTFPFHF